MGKEDGSEEVKASSFEIETARTLGKVEGFIDTFQENYGKPLAALAIRVGEVESSVNVINAKHANGGCLAVKALKDRVDTEDLRRAENIGAKKEKDKNDKAQAKKEKDKRKLKEAMLKFMSEKPIISAIITAVITFLSYACPGIIARLMKHQDIIQAIAAIFIQ